MSISSEAARCHCEQLFECDSVECLIELDGVLSLVNLVPAGGIDRQDHGEEAELTSDPYHFLIDVAGLNKLGVKRISPPVKIYFRTPLCLEVYDLSESGEKEDFTKHDAFGYCWSINTTLCDELELDQWEQLVEAI